MALASRYLALNMSFSSIGTVDGSISMETTTMSMENLMTFPLHRIRAHTQIRKGIHHPALILIPTRQSLEGLAIFLMMKMRCMSKKGLA